MNTSDRLIKKTFLGIWAVNGASTLFGIACVMIDAIMTGQFLGSDAVAASGLVQPVVLILTLVGALFGPGLVIVCTRYMGMADTNKANQAFGMVNTVIACLGIVLSVFLFLFSPTIANILSAKANKTEILQMASDYLRGFSFAIIPMCISVTLSGLMMLDNDKARAIASMLTTLVCDFLFDFLNVTVFHGGMWGMAIATALSNLAGLLVVLTHFLKKDRILHYSFSKVDTSELKEVIMCSIPNAVTMGCSAVRLICFNMFLLAIAGDVAVGALSASNSLFSLVNALSLGVFVTTSSLISLLYGEGDGNSIIKTFRFSMKIVLFAFGIVAVLLLIGADVTARVFLDAGAFSQLQQAARFIRFMAVQNFFFSVSYTFCGAYMAIRKNSFSYLLVILREGVFPIVCSLILGKIMGLRGFEIGFVLAGVMIFITCFVIPAVVNRRFSLAAKDLVLLPDGFNPKEGELFEVSIHEKEQLTEASEMAREFCLKNNMSKKDAMMTALFIEENVLNILTHGGKKGQETYVDVRVIKRDDKLVIRFRDNGKPFDPVDWFKKNHPEDPSSGLGIRIIVGLAKDVNYVPAMGLNNLMLTL